MTRRGDRAHVVCHVDAFDICAILVCMSRRQHQAKSRKQRQSVTNTNGIIPVVRHVAAPTPAPEPRTVPVIVPVVTPVTSSKQEHQTAPTVIPVVQHQTELAPEKTPASQRRPKANTRRRSKVVGPTVAKTLTVAPTAPVTPTPVHGLKQAEQPHVQTTPKRERPARAPRAARGRVKEPLRWAFSYADVAAAAGVSVDRVRHASARIGGREPSLVMTDLRSVARFIEERRHRAAA